MKPDVSTIRSGAYALTRPLYLYLPIAVAKSGNVTQASLNLANNFKEMVLSPSGQKIVEDDGFVPVAITAHPCKEANSRWKIPIHIEFDTAQDEIDPGTKQSIKIFLDSFFAENPQCHSWSFHLIGYADSVGSADLNMDLSMRRASKAKDYLKGLMCDVSLYEGKGESDFIGSNDTQEGCRKNRRVEMILER